VSQPALTRRFQAYGTSYQLRSNHEAALGHLADRARSLGWIETSGDAVDVDYALCHRRSSFDLHSDDALICSNPDLQALGDAFENHAKLQTACHAKDRLFVHAGVVSWQDRGIVIPGRSRAGKSTLVKALVDEGARYYSDEFALLDRDGRVHPYAIPLSIRAADTQPGARLPAEALGAPAADAPVPVRLIAVTEYRAGAHWQRVLSSGEALLALMDNTVIARAAPARTMPILRETVLTARALQSHRGEARGVARALLAVLE
jgi:hypothetical protein